jgi:hypothetical protein
MASCGRAGDDARPLQRSSSDGDVVLDTCIEAGGGIGQERE